MNIRAQKSLLCQWWYLIVPSKGDARRLTMHAMFAPDTTAEDGRNVNVLCFWAAYEIWDIKTGERSPKGWKRGEFEVRRKLLPITSLTSIMIISRSHLQVKSHAQKVFDKWMKGKHTFTNLYDEDICTHRFNYGDFCQLEKEAAAIRILSRLNEWAHNYFETALQTILALILKGIVSIFFYSK